MKVNNSFSLILSSAVFIAFTELPLAQNKNHSVPLIMLLEYFVSRLINAARSSPVRDLVTVN